MDRFICPGTDYQKGSAVVVQFTIASELLCYISGALGELMIVENWEPSRSVTAETMVAYFIEKLAMPVYMTVPPYEIK